MKRVFIAYADSHMAYSLQRIGKQAKRLGLFDDIVLWTPEMLPDYIQQSPLMAYRRGGGYWAWKPVIIYETLQRYEDGTQVVYIDAGCTLKKGAEWHLFFQLLERYDTLCFQYPKQVAAWAQWGQTDTAIKYWTKKKTLTFLSDHFGSSEFYNFSKFLGGYYL